MNVVFTLVFGDMNNVAVACRTFLPLDQPFFNASFVKNMVANRYLKQRIALFEINQADSTLFLRSNDSASRRSLTILIFLILLLVVGYTLHGPEIDTNHSVNISWVLFITELLKFLSFLLVCIHKVVTKNLNDHDHKEKCNRNRYNHHSKGPNPVFLLQRPRFILP